MASFNKDISIALLLMSGMWSFLSAQFVLSTLLFGGAAIFSNIAPRPDSKG